MLAVLLLPLSAYAQEEIVLKQGGSLRDAPSGIAERVLKLSEDRTAVALDFKGGYWKVKFGDRVFYVIDIFVSAPEELRERFERKNERTRKELEAWEEREFAEFIEERKRWVEAFEANVREGPSTQQRRTGQLRQGDVVFVERFKGDWAKILYKLPKHRDLIDKRTEEPDRYDDLKDFQADWMHRSLLSDEPVETLSSSEREKVERQRARAAVQERRQNFVDQNPQIRETFKQAILDGDVRIGMTKAMVRASWGGPYDVDRTVTASTTREQWVYERAFNNRVYLYFDDGVFTAFQD